MSTKTEKGRLTVLGRTPNPSDIEVATFIPPLPVGFKNHRKEIAEALLIGADSVDYTVLNNGDSKNAKTISLRRVPGSYSIVFDGGYAKKRLEYELSVS